MFTNRLFAFMLCAVSVTACNPFNRGQAVEVNTNDPMLNTRWHASLASPSELAGAVQMTGSATMVPAPDGEGTVVEVSLGNASPGGRHPWTVHEGECSPGRDYGVFGASDSYGVIEVDSDGHATGRATVDEPLRRGGAYYVAVYASEANSKMVVACGNLAAPTR
ncbi:MAG TPA: hypothetical protein VK858_12925 [Longimicrobiales bacterium]|nr:hypothetical protein [Longimicrobiales bacterium]